MVTRHPQQRGCLVNAVYSPELEFQRFQRRAETSKENLIKSFPQNFQTDQGIAGQLMNLIFNGLSLEEWKTYVSRVQAVSGSAATEVAKRDLGADALLVVITGDRARIEDGLRALGVGEVTVAPAL